MVKCELCGKELKTTQGLRGHKNFVHPDTDSGLGHLTLDQAIEQLEGTNTSTRPASEQPLSKLEDRVQLLERVTGVDKSDRGFSLSDTEPLTEKLAGITEQVTKLSDSLSKLGEGIELSKVTRDVESEEFSKRLTDLQEAHNSHSAVMNEHLDTFSNNFKIVDSRIGKIQKMVEDLDKGLDTIRTKLTAHGHDGLSLIPQLSTRLKQMGEQIATLQVEVARAKVLAIRKPTDNFETLEYKDGSKHTFRVYRGERGLSKPRRINVDPFFGNSYVDLAEPMN